MRYLVTIDDTDPLHAMIVLVDAQGATVKRYAVAAEWAPNAVSGQAQFFSGPFSAVGRPSSTAWVVDEQGDLVPVAASLAPIITDPTKGSTLLVLNGRTAVRALCSGTGSGETCTAFGYALDTGATTTLATVTFPPQQGAVVGDPVVPVGNSLDGATVWLAVTRGQMGNVTIDRPGILGVDPRTGAVTAPLRWLPIRSDVLAVTNDGHVAAVDEYAVKNHVQVSSVHLVTLDSGADMPIIGGGDITIPSGSHEVAFSPDGHRLAWWGSSGDIGLPSSFIKVAVSTDSQPATIAWSQADASHHSISGAFWLTDTLLALQTDTSPAPDTFHFNNLAAFTIDVRTGAQRTLRPLPHIVGVIGNGA